jgi:hypothetical protein
VSGHARTRVDSRKDEDAAPRARRGPTSSWGVTGALANVFGEPQRKRRTNIVTSVFTSSSRTHVDFLTTPVVPTTHTSTPRRRTTAPGAASFTDQGRSATAHTSPVVAEALPGIAEALPGIADALPGIAHGLPVIAHGLPVMAHGLPSGQCVRTTVE